MDALGLTIVLTIISLFLTYWLIRLGVRHGIQDVLRRNFPHLEGHVLDREETGP